ncbi:MAG: aminoglycoside phosphotransferase family protein [Micropepsaceae bacterium]
MITPDIATARTLIAAQFPHLAHLPLTPVASAGTDNALYRLGSDLLLRLPKAEWSPPLIAREAKILGTLANRLPLAIPQLVALGEPTEPFPHPWSILAWIEGESAHPATLDTVETATTLARFIRTLQSIEPAPGFAAGPANNFRGAPLSVRDKLAREAIAALANEIDASAATRLWDEALRQQTHQGAPVWVHGDIHPGNVLTRNGKLAAVIDWGCAATGDPAVDLMPAWSMFSGAARAVFRQEIAADTKTWTRARGWTLSVSAIALSHYRDKNETITAATRRDIAELLAGT